jgi:hypothetical protein
MPIEDLFSDQVIVKKIKTKLPMLFNLAEIECSRAGKIGMEVGSLRERIVIALLIHKFGEGNVKTDIPITEPEMDAQLFTKPISVKTITGKKLSGVKLIWTVDAQQALKFKERYLPTCDTILVHINWGNIGGFYLIKREAQEKILKEIGNERYIKLPKAGTNPRGVEITAEALETLVRHETSSKIEINWHREKVEYNQFERWIDLWERD